MVEKVFESFGDAREVPLAEVTAAPSRPVRVAIVGTGGNARIHAGALRPGAPGPATAVLAAAADIDPDRLAGFAREHRVPATYRRLEEMLAGARPDLRAGALETAVLTGRQLDRLADGDAGHLADGTTRRIVRPEK